MEFIVQLLDINSRMFELAGYTCSYIEFAGTLFGLWSVYLATQANWHTWTTGFVNIAAFFIIYYQVHLYSDMLLQVFFFVMSVFGIFQWTKKKSGRVDLQISLISAKSRWGLSALAVVSMLALGWFMAHIHSFAFLPISEPAAFPYADSFTTVCSILATFLMAKKRVECWLLWILVDVVSVVLYFQKGINFIAVEYLIFLVMASMGLLEWINLLKNEERIGTGEIHAHS
jgi:nicotinamide mononucleotide transporter